MNFYGLIGVAFTFIAISGYLNQQFWKLPDSISFMISGMVISILTILSRFYFPVLATQVTTVVSSIDFNEILMKGMLGLLLFAGALHVNLEDLLREKLEISILASFGVLISTFIIGTAIYYLLPFFDITLEYLYCLIFGALISPTDPISVLAIMKKMNANKDLETVVCGESLFNDGIGVVVFITLMAISAKGLEYLTFSYVVTHFVQEAIGGAVLGFVLGYVTYLFLKSIDSYQVEMCFTLALVTGGYALANYLHVSGPIAMVIAGLFIGNKGRNYAMSDNTRKRLDNSWELLDKILNAFLFIFIGLEILVIHWQLNYITIGFIAIFVTLFSRAISVGLPAIFIQGIDWKKFRVLTWGGLRGGISVALALSLLADMPGRELILVMTYMVVAFSVIVQGLTIKKLIY